MASAALAKWLGDRAASLDRLEDVHHSFTGGGAGRKWFTEEVNHAIITRTAAEFQAFCRDLYLEAAASISAQVSDPAFG